MIKHGESRDDKLKKIHNTDSRKPTKKGKASRKDVSCKIIVK